MEKKLSLEPDSNQWPMDAYKDICYSPPFYQLSYQGIFIWLGCMHEIESKY